MKALSLLWPPKRYNMVMLHNAIRNQGYIHIIKHDQYV